MGALWRSTIAPETSSQMEDQQAQHYTISLMALLFLSYHLEEAVPATALGPQPRTPDTVSLSQGFLPTLAFTLPTSAMYKYRHVLPCRPRMFSPHLWSMPAFLTTHRQH